MTPSTPANLLPPSSPMPAAPPLGFSTDRSEPPVLEVANLRVTFDTLDGPFDAVRGVSFALPRSSTLAIVGESGSGKSVTSYSLLRLIQPPGRISSGHVLFRPRSGVPVEITSLPDPSPPLLRLRGGQIGMIFQEPMTALSPVHSVGDQLCEAVRLHRHVSRAEARNLACEMLARVGITDPRRRLRQYPFEFSGGMRQRVVIAMACVCRPEILIADEPTTALDVTVQAQVLTLLRDLRHDLQTSVIFITHDLGVVAQVADHVLVMNQGLIVESAPARDLFKSPYHPYTKRLLLAVPRFDDNPADLERIRSSTCDHIPAGWSVTPPDNDFRSPDSLARLHSLPGGRQLLLWPQSSEARLV